MTEEKEQGTELQTVDANPAIVDRIQNDVVQGELTYQTKVVQKIVGMALETVDGLLTVDGGFFSNLTHKLVDSDDVTKGVEVEVGKKQVAVDINVVVEYGRNIPALFENIKEAVREAVNHMTGLDVIEVNVTVVDVKTRKEYDDTSESLQSKAGKVIGSSASKVKSSFSGDKSKNDVPSEGEDSSERVE